MTDTLSVDTCVIYGIKNCNTMKKAFAWLDEHRVAYRFHDYKKSGIDAQTLSRWCKPEGWQALINTRGTTWRKLTPEQQNLQSEKEAISLMQSHTSVIRRPVIESADDVLLIGFDSDSYTALIRRGGQS